MRCRLIELSNKRLFAEFVDTPINILEQMIREPERFYRKRMVGKYKKREAEVPVAALKKVQRRIKKLFDQLENPDYRHCGTRGRSYKTNAEAHAGATAFCSMDIKSYYKSSRREDAFRFLHFDLRIPEDVAWFVTDLVTYKGFVPTGSPSSQAIAFWSHIHLFNALDESAKMYGRRLTVYVDDINLSSTESPRLPAVTHLETSKLFRPSGLKLKRSKVRYSRTRQTSFEITGAISNANGNVNAPNRQKKKLFEALDSVSRNVRAFDEKTFRSKLGLLRSIRMLEPNSLPGLYGQFLNRERELNRIASAQREAEKKRIPV